MKKALILGSGGFIGGHLTKRLKSEGYYVVGADIKKHEYENDYSDVFFNVDLRNQKNVIDIFNHNVYDRVYQLAADMGGAGFVFTGENDADIMHNSALINLNVLDAVSKVNNHPRIFYSSSACIYPERNQLDPNKPICSESSAYPAAPDSEYGWEKLFSERMYLAYAKNKQLDVRIARFHNIFGPQGTWKGGREKAPAAMCRKVASANPNDILEIWGDGKQTRSFLYIDECLEGVERLMNSNVVVPINIGSDEMVTINELALMVMNIASKKLTVTHIHGPQGVRGRSSDNDLINEVLSWKPTERLNVGLKRTYDWISEQVMKDV
jgi:GDP-D-mannose 3', 5'-epimerase